MAVLVQMDLSLDLGELTVLCPEPDVAVRLPHVVPPKNDFHTHLVKNLIKYLVQNLVKNLVKN